MIVLVLAKLGCVGSCLGADFPDFGHYPRHFRMESGCVWSAVAVACFGLENTFVKVNLKGLNACLDDGGWRKMFCDHGACTVWMGKFESFPVLLRLNQSRCNALL